LKNNNAYKGKSHYSYFYVHHRPNNHQKARYGSSPQNASQDWRAETLQLFPMHQMYKRLSVNENVGAEAA
jgi:hypothetical protein